MYNVIFDFLKKIDLKSWLILILIIIIIILRSCDSSITPYPKPIKMDGKKYIVLKHDIDTIYRTKDSIIHKYVYISKEIPTPIPLNIDTIAIIKDYFTIKIYSDSIQMDSMSYFTVEDTMFKNRLLYRDYKYHINYPPVVKETTIVTLPPRNQFFLGGVIGFDKTNIINFAGPVFLYKDKKDHIYSVGVGYSNSKTISIQGGMFFKLKLKK
jgi:hypothetical protein